MDDFEVNWDHLPDDPEKFFGLEGSYDRKDLKRKYNRMIRKFKPEKHPEEFQKIRRAYEELEEQLKYFGPSLEEEEEPLFPSLPDLEGEGDEDMSVPWEALPHLLSQSVPPPSDFVPNQQLSDKILEESPSQVYDYLLKLPEKAPYHYYCLALISETRGEDLSEGHTFTSWLLEGIEKYPEEHALENLLGQYLRSPHPTEEIPSLLRQLALNLKGDQYYFLTTPLWKQYLFQVPFSEFSDLLAECESQVPRQNLYGQLSFLLQIIRLSFWRADEEWQMEKMAYLEQNFDQLPDYLEYELDFLEILQDYQKHRSHYSLPSNFRGDFEQILKDYCEKPEILSDQTILQTLRKMHRDKSGTMKALPVKEHGYQHLATPMYWVLQELENRLSHFYQNSLDEDETKAKVNIFARSLGEVTSQSLPGYAWELVGFLYVCILGMSIFLPVIALNWMGIEKNGLVLLFLLIVWNYCFWGLHVKENSIDRIRDNLSWWLAKRCYHTHWRREISKFMEETGIPYDLIVQYIEENEASHQGFQPYLVHLLKLDWGLSLYSQSLIFYH